MTSALEAGLLAMGLVIIVLVWWMRRLRIRLRTSTREIARLHDLALRRADQVSVLSHEVRTPLALIKGSADLLAEETPGPLTTTQAKFVDTISGSAEHVIALAEDLLAHARIEAGLFEVHLRQVELRAYLRTVVRELRQVHHHRAIALDAPGPPTRVYLDPQLIHQLVSNLVGNALRHDDSPANAVVVRGLTADGNVIIAISDQGRGMSEAERSRLFARFSSSAPVGEGTGLGLYISSHIAELHGGRILVDTIAQHGTTMLVTFPAGEDKVET
ncbi:two-component sensor protein [Janibacter sp. HTCC2649]|uniref:sensor histidine kinase n=1 Tax=Janibacter sp. HTCC2649 TaxID=313589 RepID=UPI000066E98C|nr:HAMP domain-containing sensor histidine kinase [Janibacter sp. HTCC2649]EAP99228.1 two-component sensor protein [Janibacter sp. HTCC2649]